MGVQVLVGAVVIAPDGRLRDRPVHPLDLAIGPRVVRFGEVVLDAVLQTDPVEHVNPIAGGRS